MTNYMPMLPCIFFLELHPLHPELNGCDNQLDFDKGFASDQKKSLHRSLGSKVDNRGYTVAAKMWWSWRRVRGRVPDIGQ